MTFRRLFPALFLSLSLLSAFLPKNSQANIIISGTRLVYPEQRKEITVKTENPGSTPALAQVWIDEGDPRVRAQDSKAPFIITPPLIRMEANGGQTFRILYIPGERELPKDVESLFYFNLLDIPPSPRRENAESSSHIQFAYRSRLKFFFRPLNLPNKPYDAAGMLVWSIANKGGKPIIRAHNPSAYHVSFNSINLGLNGKSYVVDGDMIAPGASNDMAIQNLNSLPAFKDAHVEFKWINDYGALVNQHSPISR